MNQTLFQEIQYIWFGISIFLMVLMLLNQFPVFRNTLGARELAPRQSAVFILLFSLMGICGTYWNVAEANGIINFRAVGIMLGGFLGGPLVGTAVGLVVGGFRAFVIPVGDSYVRGGLSLAQGILAGLLSQTVKKGRPLWWSSLRTAVFIEILFWSAFLLFAEHSNTEDVLLRLALPISVSNSMGVAFFIGLLENSVYGADMRIMKATREAFDSIHILFEEMRGGLGEFNVSRIADLMCQMMPQITWAAVVYHGKVYTAQQFHNQKEALQGEAEIRILQSMKTMPALPHILSVPVKDGNGTVGEIMAAKSGASMPPYGESYFYRREKEYLQGIAQLISSIHEYERMKQEKELLAEAEIRALQAQINPHFLYNTLNTISFYIRDNPETARNLVSYLSDYFRHSLSRPDAFIPLSEEVHVIACYMKLEQARFGDRLRVMYKLNGKENIEVPPLLLEPLVENAVIHGVLPLPEGGRIQVGLIDRGTHVKLYVADNGVGIPRGKRKRLLIDQRQRDRIGLINVHQRLLSLYGPESGLHILSKPGKGTIVYMTIPKEDSHG